jgi:hypothetical protein
VSTAYAAASAGDTWTAARVNDLPQGIIGYATPITASVGPTSGTTELDVITAPAVVLAASDRRLRLRFDCRGLSCTNVGDTFVLRIKEGSTTLKDASYLPSNTGVASIGSDFEAIVSSPTAASHTYKVTIVRAGGTGTASVSATATAAITFYVEDCGKV